MPQDIAWYEADDTGHELFGDNHNVLMGITGRGMPPVDISSYAMPITRVGRVQRVTYRPRIVMLPIHVKGSSEQDLWDKLADLSRWFSPAQDGHLVVGSPDGSRSRSLTCRYHGGLERDEGDESFWPWAGEAKVVVELMAVDPLWQDALPVIPDPYVNGDNPTIVNAGDEECWPYWIITGPADGVEMDNTTTGFNLHMTFDSPLGSGQVVTVDTLGGNALRNGLLPEFSSIEDASVSSLWPLAKGSNVIEIAITGGSGASQIQLSYRQRWFAP